MTLIPLKAELFKFCFFIYPANVTQITY